MAWWYSGVSTLIDSEENAIDTSDHAHRFLMIAFGVNNFRRAQRSKQARFLSATTPTKVGSSVDIQDVKSLLNSIGKDLKIDSPEGWYKLKIKSHPGVLHLNSRHKLPLVQALNSVYPNHHWLPWKFYQVPRGYWSSLSNQRAFLDWALGQLSSNESEQDLSKWYSFSTRQVKKIGGVGLLSRYGDSLCSALKSCYPDHSFVEWRFQSVPFKYWKDPKNGRAFLCALAESQGRDSKDLNFWYSVTANSIVQTGGRGLIAAYGQSPSQAIMASFPEYPWKPWKFSVLPVGWWKVGQNQRQYIQEGLVPHLISRGISGGSSTSTFSLEWLYEATTADFLESRGSGLLLLYGGSVASIARGVYPEHVWDEKFAQVDV